MKESRFLMKWANPIVLYFSLAGSLIGIMLCCRLVDVISKLDIKKALVSRHMTSVIQPILEKGIVDHSIIHRVLMEYFTIADKVLWNFPRSLLRTNQKFF